MKLRPIAFNNSSPTSTTKSSNPMEWISVKDRLPIHDQVVMAYRYSPTRGHLYRLCEFKRTFYGKTINEFQIIDDAGETSIRATHWIPHSEIKGNQNENILTPPPL